MPEVPDLIRIHEPGDLETVAEHSDREPVVLYKHSIACSLSYWAREQVVRFARGGGCPVYELSVQYARPLSNHIAKAYGIRHETPQVIVLFKNRPVFDTSHRGITAQVLQEVLQGIRLAEHRPEAA